VFAVNESTESRQHHVWLRMPVHQQLMLSVCTSIPIYLVLVVKGCFFPSSCTKHSKPTPKGHTFLMGS
jgi:hypothetical protein